MGENFRLAKFAVNARGCGQEVAVVMGVGFVGAEMAAVVADILNYEGRSANFVIGMQRPSTRSYWKIPLWNRSISPVNAEYPEGGRCIVRCVNEKKTLTASFSFDALTHADLVVVDVQCGYSKSALPDVTQGTVDMAALENSIKVIANCIPALCLVLIETTVPPGTTEFATYHIMKKDFKARVTASKPQLALSFERVMPIRDYVRSILDLWLVCSGVNQSSREKVVAFLSEVLNVKDFPPTVLDRPLESGTCKIVENSFRASLLAFLEKWNVFAERNGVDIVKAIKAIKQRPTHNNITFPGPGIGGYCLPKHGGLGIWSYHHPMGFQGSSFMITPMAIDINDNRRCMRPSWCTILSATWGA